MQEVEEMIARLSQTNHACVDEHRGVISKQYLVCCRRERCSQGRQAALRARARVEDAPSHDLLSRA